METLEGLHDQLYNIVAFCPKIMENNLADMI